MIYFIISIRINIDHIKSVCSNLTLVIMSAVSTSSQKASLAAGTPSESCRVKSSDSLRQTLNFSRGVTDACITDYSAKYTRDRN
jgi:hypothetical protein